MLAFRKETMIKCKVYNSVHTFKTRKQAEKFFTEAYYGCDFMSNEAQRYLTILEQLANGMKECTDY